MIGNIGIGYALAVAAMASRPKRVPSERALAEVAELTARGCLARISWDDDRECVCWYEATHPESIEHFRSEAQHPGALTRRQIRMIRRAR